MHYAVATIRARIETDNNWDEADQDYIRYLETVEEFLLKQFGPCDIDARNDIKQALGLPELSLEEIFRLKDSGLDHTPSDSDAKKLAQLAKDYYETHTATDNTITSK